MVLLKEKCKSKESYEQETEKFSHFKWIYGCINSGVLIDGVCEAVRHKIKQLEVWISCHDIRNFRCFKVKKYVNWERSH